MPPRLLLLLLFTLLGFAVMGYHPGLEDDGIYLAAVKANLNPALFPHSAEFFRLQTQATVFDGAMAFFVTSTHMPVAWAELFWQFVSLLAILWACHSIARQLFPEARAQWAGVAMVAAMFTLPVSGTALFLADQHLHPRNIATALILLAVARLLARKLGHALLLLAAAFFMHPLMAAMGISFCFFLKLAQWDSLRAWVRQRGTRSIAAWGDETAALIPIGWVLEPASPTWLQALNTRTYYYLYQWKWYEWLGALAPLFLFWLLWRLAAKRNERPLARFALAVFIYGVFQQCVAMIVLAPPAWVRLTPLQPMRYLQLVYVCMTLMAGCLLGKYLLKSGVWRWTVYLLVLNGGMLAYQLAAFSGSPHLELPWQRPSNPWLQAFAWIRTHTPANAYFALDPYYLRAPGEDYHGFRALAERDQVADMVKDASVVTQIPELGPAWARQVAAEQDWPHFQLADFERLKSQFGVSWVLVAYPQPTGLSCAWHNQSLAVCPIP
ncbi:MAG TPA: hypothetical protein VFB43_18180 [Terracidiphilus sp.]|nr:hypothetical protein [Terracidiphilus sp.]